MIKLYTGTPGSGKSLDVARIIVNTLRSGMNVIGTMLVNGDAVSKYKGQYIFVDIYSLSPSDLIAYARKYHVKGKEGQCLLVIDECQQIFNSRDWGAKGRQAWNSFFQLHRHYGYDVCLITQYDRLIDRQLRALVEYQYVHRKVSNFGPVGRFVSMFFHGGLFIKVCEWYMVHEKIGSEFFVYRKRYGAIYDSYSEFDEKKEKFNGLLPYLSAMEENTAALENQYRDFDELLGYLTSDTESVSAGDWSGDSGAPRQAPADSGIILKGNDFRDVS